MYSEHGWMISISVIMKDDQEKLLREVEQMIECSKKLKDRLNYLDILIQSTLLIGKGGFAD
jgi:DNA polymerase III gamma/tau subunit